MRLQLVAYAADCIIRGTVDLPDGRLTDAVAAIEVITFRDASLRALEDGHLVRCDELSVARDALCLVEVHGPRGDARRRVRTVEEMLAAEIGPYLVTAKVHTMPTANLMASVLRRGPILAMTHGMIEFQMAGERIQRPAEALAIVLGKVTSLQRPEFMPRLVEVELKRGRDLTLRAS